MNDLDIREVKFQYPDGQQALRGLTLGVAHSERVALVGANGSGKSTLLLHLNGILRAASGSLAINGVPLTDQSIPQIRAWVGLVFQNPDDQLFSPRVYDDVAFAPRYRGLPENEVRDRVQHALGLVGMEAYADRISHHLSIERSLGGGIDKYLGALPEFHQPDLVLRNEGAEVEARQVDQRKHG